MPAVKPLTGTHLGNVRVAVVIVNFRTPKLTAACVSALHQERSAIPHMRVVVVDGGSGDCSGDELTALVEQDEFRDWIEFLQLPINGGFGWANNQAVRWLMESSEQPNYIHFLNPDALIEPGAVGSLVEYLNGHSCAGAVGSQLLEPDASLSGSAFSFPSIRGEFSRGARTAALDRILGIRSISIIPSTAVEVDWVTGASVMFRVEALCQVGLFDEGFFLYYDETELMWRLRTVGWTIATEPRSRVRHIGGASTGVRSDETSAPLERRYPPYLYRSRTRFFSLTRGRAVAALAFSAWLAGYAVWRLRQVLGISSGKAREHELRDHITKAFPLGHDCVAAAPHLDSVATTMPAWMEKRWL